MNQHRSITDSVSTHRSATRPVTLTRRTLLGAAGLAAAGVAGLASCSTDTDPVDPSGEPVAAGASVQLPTFRGADLVKPDLPATDYGAQPGFYHYPADPPAFFDGKVPGEGGELATLSIINRTIPQNSDNPYWVELQKRLGVTLKPQGSLPDGYTAKFSTVIAGGDLPDTVQIIPDTVPHLPALLEAEFADLTEFVSGDAIKDYPALAAIPTNSWRSTIHNNKIYAVPLQRSALMWVGTARMDLLQKRGLPTQPKDGDELTELYRGLTDTNEGTFALALPDWVLAFICQCTGAPNGWIEEAGSFTRDYETDQYKQALGIVASFWKEGLFHPDSYVGSGAKASEWLHNGVVNGLVLQGSWAWHKASTRELVPEAEVSWFSPPQWDGGAGAKSYVGPGIFSTTVLKKASPDRIREALRVMDWLAAPFGSAESTFLTYGVEGRDHDLDGSTPVLNDRGRSEVWGTWYTSFRPQVHFSAIRDVVDDGYHSEATLLKDGVPNPTIGRYSATAQSTTAGLDRTIAAIASDIITGRKELSAWDDAVSTWRDKGGDDIRAEYQEDLQRSGG